MYADDAFPEEETFFSMAKVKALLRGVSCDTVAIFFINRLLLVRVSMFLNI